MADALLDPLYRRTPERLAALDPRGRLAAFERGELTRAELNAWAALWPEEVPRINDELPWIAATLADILD